MTDKNTCLTHQAPVLPSYRNQSIHLLYKSVGWFLNDRLNKTKKREIHEDRSHSYYYQIQLQLFVTVFFTYGLRRTCIRMPDETFWEIALPKSEVSLWTASFQNLLENFIQGSRKKKCFICYKWPYSTWSSILFFQETRLWHYDWMWQYSMYCWLGGSI